MCAFPGSNLLTTYKLTVLFLLASPGSKSVISSLKDRVSQENSGLNSESKVPSRVFQMLQKQLEDDQLEDLPPPPPELIDDNEVPTRMSFGSSGPGVQSKTFKMLQDSIGNDQAHESVFSRPSDDRNKAVPMPRKVSPAPPQQTTVNPIPKPPMPSGPSFKATSPKAPTFNANSSPNAFKPTFNANSSPNAFKPSGAPPSFKPSSSPQPASSPQVTTAKVSSQKAALPIDPSRTPICHGCNQEIRGPFVSALGRTWHPEHFVCNSCKVSLQNQGFVEEQDKLFCETCYNSFFAPKCAACDKPIIGNCVNAVGKAYHPEHFLCESCGKNFNNEGFLIEMGKPYCERCHDDLFGVKCAGCQRSITGGQRYVEALSQNWHTDCFICGACRARLEGASFYVVNGKPFCGLHKNGM